MDVIHGRNTLLAASVQRTRPRCGRNGACHCSECAPHVTSTAMAAGRIGLERIRRIGVRVNLFALKFGCSACRRQPRSLSSSQFHPVRCAILRRAAAEDALRSSVGAKEGWLWVRAASDGRPSHRILFARPRSSLFGFYDAGWRPKLRRGGRL